MRPVPAALIPQWDELEDDLAAAIRIEPRPAIDYERQNVIPLRAFNSEHFRRRELRLLHDIAERYRGVLSGKLINVTHDENGTWTKTWANGEDNDRA